MNPLYVIEAPHGTWGLSVGGVNGVLDYSRLEIAAVNEAALNEQLGFTGKSGSTTTETQLQAYGVWARNKGLISNGSDGASANLDFNNNEEIDTSIIEEDLNANGLIDAEPFPASQNDWVNLIFDGRQIGEGYEILGAPNYECLMDEP